MIKAIGFQFGLAGDAIMATVLADTFKKIKPNSHLTFALNKNFAQVLPLLFNHKSIDGFHVWEGADNWPTQKDQEYLDKQKFDIVFTPKPQHSRFDWYNYDSYINEFHRMYNLPPPESNQIYLNQWFDIPEDNKLITTSLFASGDQYSKTLSFDQIKQLFKGLESLGYKVLRLDQNTEFDHFCANIWPSSKLSLLDATKLMLSGRLHITVDSSWSWISSGYQHNSLLLLGLNYPDMETPFSHIPANPNGLTLWSKDIKDIPAEKIIQAVKNF